MSNDKKLIEKDLIMQLLTSIIPEDDESGTAITLKWLKSEINNLRIIAMHQKESMIEISKQRYNDLLAAEDKLKELEYLGLINTK